jgi:predicted AlkP superfamily phosphohydrolase/phosphomutase
MSKRTNLVSALQNASGKTTTKETLQVTERKPKPVLVKENPSTTPPSRQGKKAITGFFDPIVSRQLKQLALDEDKTLQSLLSEALNDLFIKHNHKPIA